jgi:hypothetical protein
MKYTKKSILSLLLMAAVATFAFSCTSNEITNSAAPVELVASNTQQINVIDLAGDPPGDDEEDCKKAIGFISLEARMKNPSADTNQQFNDVKVSRYRVSYVRSDGGTLVPPPFVRSIDVLLSPGEGGSELQSFNIFAPDVLTQAPFAGLLRTGRDVETNRPFIRMDVILDFFGETLAGANVAGRTRFSLDFCVSCGGCE